MKTTFVRFCFLSLVLTTGLTGCTGYVPATSVGVSVGPRPYGYGYGGYAYNPYARPYYYQRPPVIVRPRYHYRAPVPRYYGRGRGYGRGGRRW